MTEISNEWKDFLTRWGFYAVSFNLTVAAAPTLSVLKEWMRTDSPKYTGWSPFWWPTRETIKPRIIDQNTYECLHDGSGPSGHIERWRASTKGQFTIVRAHDTDGDYPGAYLDLTLPAWRIAELILYSGRMAERFESSTVDFVVRYEGLSGRVLSAIASRDRHLSGLYTSHASQYERRLILTTEDIDGGVVEMTDNLIRGLFELFEFKLPDDLVEQEIARMRSHRF